jgi:hypothetical protein
MEKLRQGPMLHLGVKGLDDDDDDDLAYSVLFNRCEKFIPYFSQNKVRGGSGTRLSYMSVYFNCYFSLAPVRVTGSSRRAKRGDTEASPLNNMQCHYITKERLYQAA